MMFILVIIFYFWAGSSNLPTSQYNQINTYDSSSFSPDHDTLGIISFNIGYLSGMTNNLPTRPGLDFFQNNMEEIIRLFRDYSPAFIGFQEIDYHAKRSWFINQMDSIGMNLKVPNGAYVVNWDKRYVPFPYWPIRYHFGKMISGQGLLSHHPIIRNKRIVLPKPDENPFYYNEFYLDRLIQIAEVDVQGTRMILMNVHLEAFDRETREMQADILKDTVIRYIEKYPLLLFGDFNSRPPFEEITMNDETTIRTILSIPGIRMAISKKEYLENPSVFYTYSSRDPVEMIDYIFYNNRIQAISFEVLEESGEISDHLPVYFKFKLNKN
jgi:endonuclease/exonuclease/phosphatase family metal-dependent hydrolase